MTGTSLKIFMLDKQIEQEWDETVRRYFKKLQDVYKRQAVSRMNKEGMSGCKTVFDVAPAYLSPKSAEELRAHML